MTVIAERRKKQAKAKPFSDEQYVKTGCFHLGRALQEAFPDRLISRVAVTQIMKDDVQVGLNVKMMTYDIDGNSKVLTFQFLWTAVFERPIIRCSWVRGGFAGEKILVDGVFALLKWASRWDDLLHSVTFLVKNRLTLRRFALKDGEWALEFN